MVRYRLKRNPRKTIYVLCGPAGEAGERAAVTGLPIRGSGSAARIRTIPQFVQWTTPTGRLVPSQFDISHLGQSMCIAVSW